MLSIASVYKDGIAQSLVEEETGKTTPIQRLVA